MTKEEILQGCTVEGTTVKLPEGQLDRKLYQEVAKALEKIGGKWKGGKIMGFIFTSDPTNLLAEIASGTERNLKKEFQFFETPSELAAELVEYANPWDGQSILEPSAGQGAIIRAINNVTNSIPDCYELMDENIDVLKKTDLDFNLIGKDFLAHTGKTYDIIIANPPFTKNQDIDHLKAMYSILNDKGTLVCITSESWVSGSQKKQVAFREWLESVDSEVIDIERGTFKESGTMVGGKIVIINK